VHNYIVWRNTTASAWEKFDSTHIYPPGIISSLWRGLFMSDDITTPSQSAGGGVWTTLI